MIEADAAARLMSETAHDLRSPLTTIRESVRLVSDGSLGRLNQEQKSFLDSAMDQCDCMDQMISEMVQLERLRSGLPRVHRRWIPVTEIRDAVDETLRPWSLPRNVSILWDGADDTNLSVFADAAMLRRLIVNLATNSIRVSADGAPVLIRLQNSKSGDAIDWSVIDQGSGIDAADLSRIAQRQVSLAAGEGLGLSICRQLAALHFSPLTIRSRKGVGTQVKFSTAAFGPNSVAERWSRWRVSQHDRFHQSEIQSENKATSFTGKSSRRMRLDPPSVAVELHSDNSTPRCTEFAAAGTVILGAAMAKQSADDFDRLIQNQLQMFDLVYRVDARRWVWILDTEEANAAERMGAISDAAKSGIPNLRLRWSEPQMVPIDDRRTANRISDLLVRQTLAASTSTHSTDANQVRLGTAPIEPSTIATTRLEVELGRLVSRMNRQTFQLQNQTKNLRPTDN